MRLEKAIRSFNEISCEAILNLWPHQLFVSTIITETNTLPDYK